MATIQLPGLLTGIDTKTLIAQLMAIERRALNMYEQRKSVWEERKNTLSTLETKLGTLRTTVKALSDADELRAFTTTSSDTDKLTAEASYNTFEGNHTVVINQLATAERWVHTTGKEYAEDYVDEGTFIYSYNHKEAIITTTATTTLQDLVGLINNDPDNPGVTASLLYYNDAYHLVLNGNDAGSDYRISVNASSTEVWQANNAFTVDGDNATLSTRITELDQFGENPLEGGETIGITGTDRYGNTITQVNLALTSNTKLSHLIAEINDAFDGNVKATLKNGKIIITDSFAGSSDLSVTLAYIDNGSSATLSLPALAASTQGGSNEVWQADSAFTVETDNAALNTKIIDLDQFGVNPFEGGEVIEITGTDHNGAPITQVNLALNENTSLEHLIAEINEAFDGIANATLENGKIILTDNTSGSSDLTINLTYNPNGSSATLTLPTMAFSTVSGTEADLEGFAASDFTKTQAAQDSKIKVDGFPSATAISEEQQIEHTPAISSGTFTLSYGGYTTEEISYNATTSEIQTALEALPSVNADDITVSGDPLNVDGTLTFTFSDTLGNVSNILIDSSNLSSTLVVTEQTKGVDAWISRSSNTVADAISGITLHLHDTTDANGEQITLTRDIQSVKDKLTSMVNAYNAAIAYIQEKTGYNNTLKTAGVLMGDYIVSTINSQLRTTLVAQASGFIADINSYLIPAEIGLELDRDGLLSLNTSVFDEAIAKNYMGVLSLIGANKTGSSNSNTIEFYSASSNYTSAGSYDVEVIVSGGAIISAGIKLSTESTYRDATFSGNIVIGDSSFDENGYPVYPENGLQLSIDLSQNGTFTATVRVKQGFAGAIEDTLDRVLKLTNGSLQINQDRVDDMIDNLQQRIENEEYRLSKREDRLIARFARLEGILALLQQQMYALGFSTS